MGKKNTFPKPTNSNNLEKKQAKFACILQCSLPKHTQTQSGTLPCSLAAKGDSEQKERQPGESGGQWSCPAGGRLGWLE